MVTPLTAMVIGKNPDQRVLDTAAELGNEYDVIVVESLARAYSQIKRIVPSLIIACVAIDDPDGCQVLSMLHLDSATSRIPVVVYATGVEGSAN